MADYRFYVKFHTHMVELKSDYTYILPAFYFATNENVAPRAEINIVNSMLSASGANTYMASALIMGSSEQESIPTINTYYSLEKTIDAWCMSLVSGNSIVYQPEAKSCVWTYAQAFLVVT